MGRFYSTTFSKILFLEPRSSIGDAVSGIANAIAIFGGVYNPCISKIASKTAGPTMDSKATAAVTTSKTTTIRIIFLLCIDIFPL